MTHVAGRAYHSPETGHIEAAQQAAAARYRDETAATDSSEVALRPIVDRFLAEVNKNVDAAPRLTREVPDDPAAADSLKFVLRTNRAGPAPATAESE